MSKVYRCSSILYLLRCRLQLLCLNVTMHRTLIFRPMYLYIYVCRSIHVSCSFSVCVFSRILCRVPQGQYGKLLCLGGEEPSACSATDCLLGVLLSQERVSLEKASPSDHTAAGSHVGMWPDGSRGTGGGIGLLLFWRVSIVLCRRYILRVCGWLFSL